VGTMRAGGPRDAPPAGSPPRAWGQYASPRSRRARARFTPTGVGTITGFGENTGYCTVHPHGRGDNDTTATTYRQLRRFTPTGVGTILRCATAVRVAHGSPPRAWGQSVDVDESVDPHPGSPPRAWGQCWRGRRLRLGLGSPPRAWGQYCWLPVTLD